jgi:hypothetical protein
LTHLPTALSSPASVVPLLAIEVNPQADRRGNPEEAEKDTEVELQDALSPPNTTA